MTSFRVIIISFFCLILVGSLLLMLPISSRQRCVTSFPDAMFTAVSATCVTGLVVKDTATYWSLFGQAVILMLIQIGGMGVITIGLAIIRASGRKIGLWQRSTMQESISAPQVGGIVKLTGFILKTSLIIEMIGAALLAPVFCNDLGIAKGLWYSLFHSISAFCNAGFDLFGIKEPFSSLTFYHSNIYLNIIIMLLIITGGIGFLVWGDIGTHKHRIRRYSLQSKVVLMTSAFLIVLPALRTVSSDILLLKHCTSFLRLNTVIAERNRTAKVAVFIPPAVEPGEPPISIRMTIMAVPDSSIAARSVVLKPAVRVVTD